MRFFYLFMIFFLFGISSCNDSDELIISEKTILVDSKTQMGYDDVHAIERPYLRVKFDENAENWTTIYGISGFDYEEGYTYVIKIREETIKNPVQDQLKTSYEFLELISKTKALD